MRIFHLAWDATTGPLPAPTKVAGAPQPEGRWQAPDDAALDCKTVKVIRLELHPRKGSNQMRKAIILAVAISAFATIFTSSSFALSPSEARDACLRERGIDPNGRQASRGAFAKSEAEITACVTAKLKSSGKPSTKQ